MQSSPSTSVVDVIIPAYDLSDVTITCLTSIRDNPANADFRVVYVDNGSKGNHRSAVINFLQLNRIPHTAIFNSTNEGFVKAVNAGMRLSQNDVVLLNNDTEVPANWLKNLQETAYCDNRIGVLGPYSTHESQCTSVEHFKGQLFPQGCQVDWQNRAKYLNEHYSKKYRFREDSMIPFFCVYIKRSTIDKVGMLDEGYDLGLGDDDDYCERIKRVGLFPTLADSVLVKHSHRTTFNYAVPNYKELQERNMKKFKDTWGK